MNGDILNVLIVGCGNIAGAFDRTNIKRDLPYTHAGAYTLDSRFSIQTCIEPDDDRRLEFMESWHVKNGFRSIGEILNSDDRFDVISICSPSGCHAYDLEVALTLNPKLIFCEKPITTSIDDAERLVKDCREKDILLAVNYSRRFDPDISKLHIEIQAGARGKLRSVVGCYNKGVLNNGSHMIDLLNFLLGPLKLINVGKPIDDFFQNDPAIPVWLESEQGIPIQIACAHASDYAVFELQFIFSEGILTMEDGGLFWRDRRVVDSENFKGYRVLNEGIRRLGKYPQAMMQAIDNIYGAITKNEILRSSGDSALLAQKMCEKIKQASLKQWSVEIKN
jgi:predicted dehydrogenase